MFTDNEGMGAMHSVSRPVVVPLAVSIGSCTEDVCDDVVSSPRGARGTANCISVLYLGCSAHARLEAPWSSDGRSLSRAFSSFEDGV